MGDLRKRPDGHRPVPSFPAPGRFPKPQVAGSIPAVGAIIRAGQSGYAVLPTLVSPNAAKLTQVSMRVSSRQQTGDLGESRVGSAFLEIGWASPVKVPRDIGDDLITFARTRIPKVVTDQPSPGNSTDLFDLSAPVLVQVKASKVKYRNTKSTHEKRNGWWFYETTSDHFDHWLRFDLPYLLVLHDEKHNESYWVHVHHDNIVATDNARKIFVPQDQRIDETSATALNEVAVSARTAAFAQLHNAGGALTPGQRLRHALITPHLALPRAGMPNRLTYDQVVAMLLLDRQFDIGHAVRVNACPNPATWRTHKAWGWRFVQALREVIDGGSEPAALGRLAKKAPSKYERDACQVVRGCVAYIEQRPTAALHRFQPDRYSKPVDRAWLHTHRAHTLLETGDTTGAADAAQVALLCLQAQAGDLSATVIRAEATTVLYTATSDEDPARREAALIVARAAQINLGSLGRAENVSDALASDLESRFRTWSGERSGRFGSSGSTAHTQLTAAAWNAALSAGWASWRQITRRAAQVTFTNSADIDDVNDALTAVTRANGKKEAKAAAERVWLNGPVEALRRNVSTIASSKWTLRTEGQSMEILAAGGDLLTPGEADETIDRILTLLAKHGPVRRMAGGWTDRWSEADRTLARLLYAATDTGHEKCAILVVNQFGTSDNRPDAVLRIAHSLRVSDLSESTRIRLVEVAQKRDDHYQAALLELLAEDIPNAISALKELAAGGDTHAARALLVVGERSTENWKTLGKQSVPAVLEMIQNATGNGQSRTFSFGAVPSLHDLALAAFHSGNAHHWKVVTDALAAGVLSGQQMDGCIQFLASHYNALPNYVQKRLKRLAPALRAHEDNIFDIGSFNAAVFALRLATGILDDGETLAGLLETRATASVDFAGLVGDLPTSDREAFLLACTIDPDPHVRAQAAYGVVRIASQNPDRAPALATALRKSLELNDGCRMPVGVGTALNQFKVRGFEDVRGQLRSNPSAVVRRLVS